MSHKPIIVNSTAPTTVTLTDEQPNAILLDGANVRITNEAADGHVVSDGNNGLGIDETAGNLDIRFAGSTYGSDFIGTAGSNAAPATVTIDGTGTMDNIFSLSSNDTLELGSISLLTPQTGATWAHYTGLAGTLPYDNVDMLGPNALFPNAPGGALEIDHVGKLLGAELTGFAGRELLLDIAGRGNLFAGLIGVQGGPSGITAGTPLYVAQAPHSSSVFITGDLARVPAADKVVFTLHQIT